ncbi:MAG: restriction endonuclease subunit S [Thermodesulfobacteriota bacterium]|nr:restriction endonuclease subunit S [Thermodesulfobacteriota bacterium]
MSKKDLNPGWEMVKFGDIAQNVAVRVDPAEAKTDIYVGLEHLDPDTLHLRQWGHPSDVIGQKLAFKKGDVIFGRRRAYQRKLAVAEFDGICSAHAMVVRAKAKMILPEFLPFFLQSDMFMERAIEISVGSLSPTINWKTLKEQEFPLPPLDEQKRIADILWAADETEYRLHETYHNLAEIEKRELIRVLEGGLTNAETEIMRAKSLFQTQWINRAISIDWKLRELREVIVEAKSGFASGDRSNDGLVQLRMNNVSRRCQPSWDELTRIPVTPEEYSSHLLVKGDILFNNTNSEDLVGKSFLFEGYAEPVVFSNHFTRLRVDEDQIVPEYCALWIKRGFWIGLFQRRCQRWIGQAAVQQDNLLSLQILLPTLGEQKRIVDYFREINSKFDEIEKHIQILRNIRKSLTNKLLPSEGDSHV